MVGDGTGAANLVATEEPRCYQGTQVATSAADLLPGDLYRKVTGTYVYISIALDAAVQRLGGRLDRRLVHGVSFNGVISSIAPTTAVVRATWREFMGNVGDTAAWNATFARGEVPGEQGTDR